MLCTCSYTEAVTPIVWKNLKHGGSTTIKCNSLQPGGNALYFNVSATLSTCHSLPFLLQMLSGQCQILLLQLRQNGEPMKSLRKRKEK